MNQSLFRFLALYRKAKAERQKTLREHRDRDLQRWKAEALMARKGVYNAGRFLALYRKKIILVLAAAVYIISALHAPWTAKAPARMLQLLADYNEAALTTYGSIFSPPDCSVISNGLPCHYELNVSLLLVEWLFIALLTVIAWLWGKS